MSRTDGHEPYWVQAKWYEPDHYINCPLRTQHDWAHWAPAHVCDLPERPVRQRDVAWRQRTKGPSCVWSPMYPSWRENRPLVRGPGVPKWYRDHVWFNPERVQERDMLRGLAREYNAHGDLVDGDFANYQHRHGAIWYWD